MAYFVKRRDESGTIYNTLCHTLEEVWQKVASLRANDIECWVEDGGGNPIGDQFPVTARKLDRGSEA